MPERLGTLGLPADERRRHIAWDIGIAALGEMLAERLDAVFIAQAYSRLVVDCNRDTAAPDLISEVADGTRIPGNAALSAADRDRRIAEIHEPYQGAIAADLARRDRAGGETILVALHSFTPVMNGRARPWQIGVLHDRGDASFAVAVLDRLRGDGIWTVGDNQPYRMDVIDYTIPRHAYDRGRRYVELEIRQDLIADTPGQAAWADHLAKLLCVAARR